MIALLLLFACSPKLYTVHMGDQPPNDAHYVVMRTKMTGTMVIYDCRSMLDPKTWEPTCVKVDVRAAPPKTED